MCCPSTDVRTLLESSADFLTKAREGRYSSSNLWWLEIIISEGICHDHEDLRSILCRAEQGRIWLTSGLLELLSTHILLTGTGTLFPYNDNDDFIMHEKIIVEHFEIPDWLSPITCDPIQKFEHSS